MEKTFSLEDQKALEPAMKIGLLATINEAGLPHLTLISSLTSLGEKQVIWGQFTEGSSKVNVARNPKTAFLVMTLDRRVWRGKAIWRETKKGGTEFEAYNNQPMFRYNAYFGIHTVHYMDLVEQSGASALPMNAIVAGAVATLAARPFVKPPQAPPSLNDWTGRFLAKMDCLKFLAVVGADGFPQIVPVIQAQPTAGNSVLFAGFPYGKELRQIPAGSPAALLGLSLNMEDVLLRGEFGGLRSVMGIPTGRLAVDWVYNPMPPVAKQVYPPLKIQPVTDF